MTRILCTSRRSQTMLAILLVAGLLMWNTPSATQSPQPLNVLPVPTEQGMGLTLLIEHDVRVGSSLNREFAAIESGTVVRRTWLLVWLAIGGQCGVGLAIRRVRFFGSL